MAITLSSKRLLLQSVEVVVVDMLMSQMALGRLAAQVVAAV
jgi:hypothetical protein